MASPEFGIGSKANFSFSPKESKCVDQWGEARNKGLE